MQIERPWLRARPSPASEESLVQPKPLYSVLTDTAKRLPGNACLFYQGRTFTYAQIDELSSRFASGLISLGLKKGDRVAIFLPNTPQFVISYFGILKAGCIVVACSPLYKERELEFQLRDSGAQVIVAATDVIRERSVAGGKRVEKWNDLFDSLEKCRQNLPLKHVISTSVTDYLPGYKKGLARFAGVKNVSRKGTVSFVRLVGSMKPLEKFADVNPVDDLAVLQYTGGTTGTSKGAMLTHYNLLSNAVYSSMFLPINEKDVALAVLPLFHIYGMSVIMNSALAVGAQVVLLPRFHVEDVMKAIQNERVTVFCGVPTMYIAIIHSPKLNDYDLRTIRACISGGAALPVEVRRQFNKATGGNLVEGYGLTESSPITHCNPVHDGEVKNGSVGMPFLGTDAAIVDQDDPTKFLGVGEVGELAVKGPQVMKGYWNKSEETALVLRDGWLLTGDIAKMDGDGYFFIVDRKKDMINVGGLKVYPREVEEVLFMHPAVREASVVSMPDSFTGEAVEAFVVLKDGGPTVTEEDLIAFCATNLSKYKVPRKVVFVGELPKTLVGKVLRRKLRESSAPQS